MISGEIQWQTANYLALFIENYIICMGFIADHFSHSSEKITMREFFAKIIRMFI